MKFFGRLLRENFLFPLLFVSTKAFPLSGGIFQIEVEMRGADINLLLPKLLKDGGIR